MTKREKYLLYEREEASAKSVVDCIALPLQESESRTRTMSESWAMTSCGSPALSS